MTKKVKPGMTKKVKPGMKAIARADTNVIPINANPIIGSHKDMHHSA